jgi:exonuclease III
MGNDNIIIWNVRGSNSRARRDVVRMMVVDERPSVICLQGTKLHVLNDYNMLQLLGHDFDYAFLPSIHTRVGILIAWSRSSRSLSSVATESHSITAMLRHINLGLDWWITSVYDPTVDIDKPTFLSELRGTRESRPGLWLVCGDFNMIYRAKDKSNDRLDRWQMGPFH